MWAQDDEGNVYVEEMDIRKYDVQRIRRSATLNIDWKIDSRNTIAADLMYNWRDDREARYRTQFKDIEPVYDGSAITGYEGTVVRETKGGIDDRRNRTRRLEDQRVQSYVLSGTHLLSPKVDMDWSLSYAKASEDRPHERYIEYVQEGLSMNEDLADTRLPYINAPGQNYSDFVFDKLTEQHDYTQEEEYAAKVNLRMPLSVVREQKGRLRVGLSARWKNKRRSNDFYEYVPTGSMPVLSDMEHVVYDRPLVQGDRYVPGMFVSSGYIGNVDLYNPSLFTPEADPSEYMAGNYDAGERILAGYLRWDQNITNDLMFIAGVRVENTDLDYRGNYILDEDYDNADERHNRNNYTNVLPGLTLKYDLNDRTVLRAAFTTALARPNYYALVPYVDIQREKREITAGNPNLKATYSYNFDLLGEYYSKSVGIVSGGLFYKRLDNFIFNYLDIDYTAEKFAADFPGFTNPIGEGEVWEYLRPMNGRSVDMFGFEVALQRKLDFLPGRFLRRDAQLHLHPFRYPRNLQRGRRGTYQRVAARYGSAHGERLALVGKQPAFGARIAELYGRLSGRGGERSLRRPLLRRAVVPRRQRFVPLRKVRAGILRGEQPDEPAPALLSGYPFAHGAARILQGHLQPGSENRFLTL